MKKQDLYFILGMAALFAPFFLIDSVYEFYNNFNREHSLIMSFVKFGILATLGEMLGLRIRTGDYNQPGFGILPRAIVWGLLGITIKIAFVVFATGTPILLDKLFVDGAVDAFRSNEMSGLRILAAFSISFLMNLIYAPVMMTLHKITDTHILDNGGTVKGLFKSIPMGQIFSRINWDVQYNFVFKKTIPFFWIPMHTITFLLPEDMRVLFAALLGIALGVILAVAAQMGKK
ncbi:MAG: hypothetical protein JEZ03_00200 [Bacteroidales bacterium]|nr:hypothetical protein [Bacteroidales bacterium]